VRSYDVDQFGLTRISSDTALLVYHARQDTTCGSALVPSPVWASSLYVLRGGRWQNAALPAQSGRQVKRRLATDQNATIGLRIVRIQVSLNSSQPGFKSA